MSSRIPSHGVLLAVGLTLLTTLPSAGSTTDTACEPNQATAAPCVIDLTELGSQALVQTLPFDVPVFLQGTAPPELDGITVHVFHGDNPFRVRKHCDDSLDAETCTYHCFRQGESMASQKDQAAWARRQFQVGAKQPQECNLIPWASEWRGQTPPIGSSDGGDGDGGGGAGAERTFRLRIPPLSPNTHFVFLLEEQRRVDLSTRSDLRARVDRELTRTLIRDDRNKDLEALLVDIREDGCQRLRQVARAEGLMLSARDGALFDCGGGDIDLDNVNPGLRKDLRLLTDFYSAETEVRSNIEGCFENWTVLKDRLEALRVEFSSVPKSDLSEEVLRRLSDPDADSPANHLARGRWEMASPAPGGDASNPCVGADLPRLADGYAELTESLKAAEDRLTVAGKTQQAALVNKALAAAETLRGVAGRLAAPQVKLEIADDLTAMIVRDNWLVGDNIGTFLTRQKGYIAADFGFAFAPELERALPYIGTNIYLRPVNKNAPLPGLLPWNRPMQRFSLSIGLVIKKIDDTQAESLFGDFSLLTGAGFRITESARLSGGVLWAREKSNSPLNEDSSLVWSPYLAVSLDYDVKTLTKWFDKAF